MNDQLGDWVCPWDICNHDDAQACRANPKGCLNQFHHGITLDEAKAQIKRPLRSKELTDRSAIIAKLRSCQFGVPLSTAEIESIIADLEFAQFAHQQLEATDSPPPAS